MKTTSRVAAGIFAILLGSFGIHKFYMGYVTEGIIMLVVTVFLGGIHVFGGMSLVAVVGIIEGIIYLTKSDSEFYSTYIAGRKGWL